VARVVAVHGIGQQFKGEHSLHAEWLPALRDGLARAGVEGFAGGDLACAFYGDLFRPSGTKAIGAPGYDFRDVEPEWELALLELLWGEAARVEPAVTGPDVPAKTRTPMVAQRALRALASSRFFAGLAERVVIADLKQVRAYVQDVDDVRAEVRECVAKAITADTVVVVGHSLGSVIAYETLAHNKRDAAVTLVTLGSPLGIRNLIFDHLWPRPADGKGEWPGAVLRWINVADRGDVVALVKRLAPLFDERIDDRLVHNGATAHDARPYLTAVETGSAIAAGLGT